MKKIFFAAFVVFFFFGASSQLFAERMFIEKGTTRTYPSPNGRYTVKAVAQAEGGMFWSLTLLEGEKEISSTHFRTPGALAVSDSGTMIAGSNPTRYAEFGSESVSLYDAQWKLIRKISFEPASKGIDEIFFRVIEKMVIAPDNSFLVIGEDHRENSSLAVYDTVTGALLWAKETGLPEIHEIVISPDSAYLLTATHDENRDLLAQLFDRSGNLLSEKRVPKAFNSYEINYVRFSQDGQSFEVLDTDRNVRATEKIPV